MSEECSKSPIEQKQSHYPVMLVQAPYAHGDAEGAIQLADILGFFRLQWKWLVALIVLCLCIATPVLYQQGQLVSYQQLISIPTSLSGLGINAQRSNIYKPESIIQSFNANYVLSWKSQGRAYVNKDFALVSKLFSSSDLDQQLNSAPDGMLLLKAKAPIQGASAMQQLFGDSLNAVRAIVNEKVVDLKKSSQEKIKADESDIQALQLTLQQLQHADSHDANQGTNMASIQAQLLMAKNILSKDQFGLASLQSEVKPVGGLLIGQPGLLWLVILKALIVSVVLVVVLSIVAAFIYLGAITPNGTRVVS
jgi:hypothetical protein